MIHLCNSSQRKHTSYANMIMITIQYILTTRIVRHMDHKLANQIVYNVRNGSAFPSCGFHKGFASPTSMRDYLAEAVLLEAVLCTAAVLAWSYLANGNAIYAVVQVVTNDSIILFVSAPIAVFRVRHWRSSSALESLLLPVILLAVIS